MNLLPKTLYFTALFCLATVSAKPGKKTHLNIIIPTLFFFTLGARIIGGDNAPAGRFPFAAAIYVQTGNSRFFCGGALLNHQWVITSGHCADG